MDSSDVVVIIAESLPLEQALDLMKWYCFAHYKDIGHPSINWWIVRHAGEIWENMK